MPYNEPDPTDPNLLIGVGFPTDVDTTEDMAYVFAEEYCRIGFDKERIMGIFNRPFYAGAHKAYLELGKEKIESIVDECQAIWGRERLK